MPTSQNPAAATPADLAALAASQAQQAVQAPAPAQATQSDGQAAQDVASLPDWAQQLIKGLRSEAADRRSRAKTVEADAASLQERIASLEAQAGQMGQLQEQLRSERLGRLRDRLALERGIPVETAALVAATDEESMTKALDALAALKTGPAATRPLPNPAQTAQPAAKPGREELADQLFARLGH